MKDDGSCDCFTGVDVVDDDDDTEITINIFFLSDDLLNLGGGLQLF